MKNSEVWGQYKDYTRDITEFSRKLGFAGAGICWVLKEKDGSFPDYVLIALGLFVLYFLADILQGMVGALLLRHWIRKEEIRLYRESNTIDGEYNKPAKLDYPSFTLFLLKIVFILLGFVSVALGIVNTI